MDEPVPQLFLNYGLSVKDFGFRPPRFAMMAHHLEESPWRWAFILLSLAGSGQWASFWIRRYAPEQCQGRCTAGGKCRKAKIQGCDV